MENQRKAVRTVERACQKCDTKNFSSSKNDLPKVVSESQTV